MAYQSKYTGLQIDDILDSVEWKQGKIEDLASIRAGAQKGATALQSYTEKYTGTVTGVKINGVVKSGSGVIDLGTISTDISGKQDKLVDGVNIATINGQSLTKGGDIEISGRSENEIIELTTLNINISEMLPNVIYVGRFAATGVSITSFATSDSIIDEYTLVCSTEPGLESVPISLPDDVIWANGVRPEVNSGDYFELSIRRKSYYYCAVLTPFKAAE